MTWVMKASGFLPRDLTLQNLYRLSSADPNKRAPIETKLRDHLKQYAPNLKGASAGAPPTTTRFLINLKGTAKATAKYDYVLAQLAPYLMAIETAKQLQPIPVGNDPSETARSAYHSFKLHSIIATWSAHHAKISPDMSSSSELSEEEFNPKRLFSIVCGLKQDEDILPTAMKPVRKFIRGLETDDNGDYVGKEYIIPWQLSCATPERPLGSDDDLPFPALMIYNTKKQMATTSKAHAFLTLFYSFCAPLYQRFKSDNDIVSVVGEFKI